MSKYDLMKIWVQSAAKTPNRNNETRGKKGRLSAPQRREQEKEMGN
jgi:hypothetical protein